MGVTDHRALRILHPGPWQFLQPVVTLNGTAEVPVRVHVAPNTSAELQALMDEHFLDDPHDYSHRLIANRARAAGPIESGFLA